MSISYCFCNMPQPTQFHSLSVRFKSCAAVVNIWGGNCGTIGGGVGCDGACCCKAATGPAPAGRSSSERFSIVFLRVRGRYMIHFAMIICRCQKVVRLLWLIFFDGVPLRHTRRLLRPDFFRSSRISVRLPLPECKQKVSIIAFITPPPEFITCFESRLSLFVAY